MQQYIEICSTVFQYLIHYCSYLSLTFLSRNACAPVTQSSVSCRGLISWIFLGYLSAVPNQAAVLVIQQLAFVSRHFLLSPVLYSRVLTLVQLSAITSTVICYHYFINSSGFFSTMQLRACCLSPIM